MGGSKAESVTSTSGEEVLTDTNDDECYFCEGIFLQFIFFLQP